MTIAVQVLIAYEAGARVDIQSKPSVSWQRQVANRFLLTPIHQICLYLLETTCIFNSPHLLFLKCSLGATKYFVLFTDLITLPSQSRSYAHYSQLHSGEHQISLHTHMNYTPDVL